MVATWPALDELTGEEEEIPWAGEEEGRGPGESVETTSFIENQGKAILSGESSGDTDNSGSEERGTGSGERKRIQV